MIRGLVEDWQFPFWSDFDKPITKQLLDEVIITAEGCGNTVLAFTCDQGGANEGLRKSLGITKDNQSFQNPAHPNDPDKVVYFLHDYVHVEKLWRNAVLDHEITFDDGVRINAKKIFQQLSNYCRAHELSAGYYLKDILIHLKGSDRQTVKYAINLMSNTSASLIRQHLPPTPENLRLAELCDDFHNSRMHSEF